MAMFQIKKFNIPKCVWRPKKKKWKSQKSRIPLDGVACFVSFFFFSMVASARACVCLCQRRPARIKWIPEHRKKKQFSNISFISNTSSSAACLSFCLPRPKWSHCMRPCHHVNRTHTIFDILSRASFFSALCKTHSRMLWFLCLACVVHFAFTFMFYFSSFARRCVIPCKLLSVLVWRKFNRKKSFAKCLAVNRFRWIGHVIWIHFECRNEVRIVEILLYFAIVFISSTSSSFSPYSHSLRLSSANRRTIHTCKTLLLCGNWQRILTGGIMCKISALACARLRVCFRAYILRWLCAAISFTWWIKTERCP